MGYEGHVVDLGDRAEREKKAKDCLQRLVEHARRYRSGRLGRWHMLLFGYGKVTISARALMGSRKFRPDRMHSWTQPMGDWISVWKCHCATTVGSCPTSQQVITDAGPNSCQEHGFLVKGRSDLECHALSEEHGRYARPTERTSRSAVGDLAGVYSRPLLNNSQLHTIISAPCAVQPADVRLIAARQPDSS